MFEDQASVLGHPKRNSWPQGSGQRPVRGQSPTVTEPDDSYMQRGSFDHTQYAFNGHPSYANQYPGQQLYGTSPHQGQFVNPSGPNQNSSYADQSYQLSQSVPQSSALAHFQTQSAPQAKPDNSQVANFFPATQSGTTDQSSAATQADTCLFGADYVSDTRETFYLREQPTRPQADDGKIRSPAMNGAEFHDAFKCDWSGKEGHTLSVTVKDLPSKDAKCSVKHRRVMGLGLMAHAWAFYKGSSTETSALLGHVKRNSDTKATVTLENTAANKYTAEGNMLDLTYNIKMGSTIVAAVQRDQTATRATGSRHSYGVTVAPHTDCLLMIAIALCIEGLWRAKP